MKLFPLTLCPLDTHYVWRKHASEGFIGALKSSSKKSKEKGIRIWAKLKQSTEFYQQCCPSNYMLLCFSKNLLVACKTGQNGVFPTRPKAERIIPTLIWLCGSSSQH